LANYIKLEAGLWLKALYFRKIGLEKLFLPSLAVILIFWYNIAMKRKNEPSKSYSLSAPPFLSFQGLPKKRVITLGTSLGEANAVWADFWQSARKAGRQFEDFPRRRLRRR